jgi:hypothetical protein
MDKTFSLTSTLRIELLVQARTAPDAHFQLEVAASQISLCIDYAIGRT